MDILGFSLAALPLALGTLGTWFLVNEVDHAHDFEHLSREKAEAEEFLGLYRTDLREFWIRSAMISFKCDRAKAAKLANELDEKHIIDAAAPYKEFWEDKVVTALDRWNKKITQAQLKKRRRLLWTGFWLLMTSAGIQLMQAIPKFL
jgi:hypothetical protein